MAFSSSQVSQLVGGQMSMFQGQAQYAHQIGIAHGVLPPGASMGGQGPSFGGQGYGGQSLGLGIQDTSIGGMGAGMIGGMGGAMRGIGQATDIAGLGMAGASLLGVGGAAMGAASLGALPVAAGLAFGGQQIQQGAQNISQVGGMAQQYMGPQFGGGGGGRAGGALPRETIRQITSILHEIAGEDTMATFADLKRIMDQAGQMGMLTGIQNAQQFKTQFSSMIKGVRQLAEVMGTSLEEAAPLFGQMRSMGMWSPQDVMGTAAAMRVAGPQAAPALMQTMAAGAQGSFARGGKLAAGAATGREQFGIVQEAVRSGIMSQEAILELTGGIGGVEGQQKVAQQLTGVMQSIGQTPAGRLAMAGLGEMQGGRFTGRMDPKLLQRFLSGGVSIGNLQARGMKATSTRAGAASFTAHQDMLAQNLSAEGGMAATGAIVEAALEKAGFGAANEDIQQLMISKMFGMNSRQSQLLQKMMANLPELQQRRAEATKQKIEDSFRRADEKMNRSWQGFRDAIGQSFEEQFERPIQEAAEAATTRANEIVDRITDRVWDRQIQIKATRAERLRMLSRGVGGPKFQQAMRDVGAQGLEQRPIEERLDTPIAERIREGTSRAERARFIGVDERALSDMTWGGIDAWSERTKRQVEEGLDQAMTRSRSDFALDKAFNIQGREAEARVAQAKVTAGYRAILSDPEKVARLRELKDQGLDANAYASQVARLMREDPSVATAMDELGELRLGGTAAMSDLNMVSLADKETGVTALGVDRKAMAGVIDFEKLRRDSAARQTFIQDRITMATKASTPKTVAILTKLGVSGVLGLPISVIGEITGITEEVAAGFTDLSTAEIQSAMQSNLSTDLARFLADGTKSAQLEEELRQNPESPVSKVMQRSTQLSEEQRKKFTKAFVEVGALEESTERAEIREQRSELARKELRGIGSIEGISRKTRQKLQGAIEAFTSEGREEQEAAITGLRKFAEGLGPKEIAALRRAGGPLAGQAAAMGALRTLGREGMTEAQFRKQVRRKVSGAAGFDVFTTLQQAAPERFEELMGLFDPEKAGGAQLTSQELARAKELIGGERGVLGGRFMQEQRGALEDTNAAMAQKLIEYTDANTKFVTAVDVALPNLKGVGMRDLFRRGRELNDEATKNKERG